MRVKNFSRRNEWNIMAESKIWKKAVITTRNPYGYETNIPVRTDGTVIQIWQSITLDKPYATPFEEWLEAVRDMTDDMVDKVIDFDAIPCNGGECGASPEAEIYMSGWRGELTATEKEAVSKLTFI